MREAEWKVREIDGEDCKCAVYDGQVALKVQVALANTPKFGLPEGWGLFRCEDNSCIIYKKQMVPFEISEDEVESMVDAWANEVEDYLNNCAEGTGVWEVTSAGWWLGYEVVHWTGGARGWLESD